MAYDHHPKRRIMRSLIAGIYIILFVIYASIGILIDKIIKITPNFTFRNLRSLSKTLIKISGSNVEVEGLENLQIDDNFLIVANHSSMYDPMLIAQYLDKNRTTIAVVKVELSKFYPIKYWLTRQGCEFIDRKDMRQSIKAITNTTNKVKAGADCIIFPEGTRSDEAQEFKAGSLKIAQKSKKPIIPVTIIGASAMFEKSKRIKKADVKVIFHPAIAYSEYENMKLPEIAEMTQKIVESGFERINK